MRHLVDGSALLVRHHPHHLGDDISGLAQHHPIADGQLLFVNEIFIMQGGAADGGTGQGDRLEQTGRRQHTGAPDVYLHIQQGGFLFLRRVFIGHGPFGEF